MAGHRSQVMDLKVRLFSIITTSLGESLATIIVIHPSPMDNAKVFSLPSLSLSLLSSFLFPSSQSVTG